MKRETQEEMKCSHDTFARADCWERNWTRVRHIIRTAAEDYGGSPEP